MYKIIKKIIDMVQFQIIKFLELFQLLYKNFVYTLKIVTTFGVRMCILIGFNLNRYQYLLIGYELFYMFALYPYQVGLY